MHGRCRVADLPCLLGTHKRHQPGASVVLPCATRGKQVQLETGGHSQSNAIVSSARRVTPPGQLAAKRKRRPERAKQLAQGQGTISASADQMHTCEMQYALRAGHSVPDSARGPRLWRAGQAARLHALGRSLTLQQPESVHPPHLALAITSYKGWAAAGTCARSDMVSKVSMVSTRQENILAIE
jgi:hypothetical protein